MSRWAHAHPDDPEGAWQTLLDAADEARKPPERRNGVSRLSTPSPVSSTGGLLDSPQKATERPSVPLDSCPLCDEPLRVVYTGQHGRYGEVYQMRCGECGWESEAGV